MYLALTPLSERVERPEVEYGSSEDWELGMSPNYECIKPLLKFMFDSRFVSTSGIQRRNLFGLSCALNTR